MPPELTADEHAQRAQIIKAIRLLCAPHQFPETPRLMMAHVVIDDLDLEAIDWVLRYAADRGRGGYTDGSGRQFCKGADHWKRCDEALGRLLEQLK